MNLTGIWGLTVQTSYRTHSRHYLGRLTFGVIHRHALSVLLPLYVDFSLDYQTLI